MYDAVLDFNKKWIGFRAAVGTLRAMRAQQRDDSGAWMNVHNERTEASTRLDRVAELINAELATP